MNFALDYQRSFVCQLHCCFLDVAHAQQLPKSVTPSAPIRRARCSTALASGLAKVVSEAHADASASSALRRHQHLRAAVRQRRTRFRRGQRRRHGNGLPGPNFKVGGRNPFPHVASSRLIMRGSPLRSSLIVRKDSPIKTLAMSKVSASPANIRRSSRSGTTCSARSRTPA